MQKDTEDICDKCCLKATVWCMDCYHCGVGGLNNLFRPKTPFNKAIVRRFIRKSA